MWSDCDENRKRKVSVPAELRVKLHFGLRGGGNYELPAHRRLRKVQLTNCNR
jgi:hypothetical protein